MTWRDCKLHLASCIVQVANCTLSLKLQFVFILKGSQLLNPVLLRERVIRFLFTLDDMRNLSSPAQHSLLRSNLSNVQMLAQIFTCNLRTIQDEVSFIFSQVKKGGPSFLFCHTPDLGLRLSVDFTFAKDKKTINDYYL